MRTTFYVTMNERGKARLTKNRPDMFAGEVSAKFTVSIPDSAFRSPFAEVTINIPEEALIQPEIDAWLEWGEEE